MAKARSSPDQKYYFGAGPAALPLVVKQRIQGEFLDYHNRGISITEISHRSDAFLEIVAASKTRLRSLLSIPNDYQILFLPAGARTQFAVIPLNLSTTRAAGADYLLSGYWSTQAAKEAHRYLNVNTIASSADDDFNSIPPASSWKLNNQATYVYLTANETIKGVELHDLPTRVERPLIVDMTSNLLTRPIDVSSYSLIFASTQKNLGTAGLCLIIIHQELLERTARPETPSIFNYALQARAESILNTPPVITWYIADLMLEWCQQQGGVAAIEKRHIKRSGKLYSVIDRSSLFFNTVVPECRSRVNISFEINEPRLRETFLAEAAATGLLSLAGHHSVGAFRASLYNGLPDEGVESLIDFIQSFSVRYG